MILFCPDLVGKEEVKAVMIGHGDFITAKDGTGNRYVRLWSAAEIANLLKVPKIEAHNFDLSIRNGDSTSNPVHFYTPEYWNDGNFYAYTWLGSDGNVRVDYRMEYPTIGL